MNRLFERQPRPVTDPGFGSYWTVNLLAPPGTKRPRKRGRPNKEKDVLQTKKRGRPRTKDGPYGSPTLERSTHEEEDYEEDGPGTEEDEFESEEDASMQIERRPVSLQQIHPPPPPPIQSSSYASSSSSTVVRHPHPNPFPVDHNEEARSNLIERLQIEVAGLRRQSADAVSLSIRLTDQLAQAQAEASRSKATLRTVEAMLEEESRKRREAERDADEEADLRRSLEEQLKDLRMRWSSASRPP